MKREDFLERKDALLHEVQKIHDSIKELETQYINESELFQFQIGEKVRVIKRNKTEEGFVVGKYVSRNGRAVLSLKRCRKDGGISQLDLPPYFPELGDRIEKIESV